jgi:hypothetical protein
MQVSDIMFDEDASETVTDSRYWILIAFFFFLFTGYNFRAGPNFKNIMFKDERIAYEVSMNDISLIYSANDPVGGNVSYYFCHVILSYVALSQLLVRHLMCIVFQYDTMQFRLSSFSLLTTLLIFPTGQLFGRHFWKRRIPRVDARS